MSAIFMLAADTSNILKKYFNLDALCACLIKLLASQKHHVVHKYNVTCKPPALMAVSTHGTHYIKFFRFSDLMH